jgi:membrane-bound metal-dependent hydrolase YbcI (DUF457 family)
MLPFGHAAGGYLIGTLLSVATKSRPKDAKVLRVLGIVGGILPDLDIWAYHALRKPMSLGSDFQHHTWLTHTLPCYLVPGSLIAIWASRTKRTALARYSIVLTASICIHLIQDMVGSGDGIQLFFPFSRRMFGIRLFGVHGKEWRAHYTRDPIFVVEIELVLLALAMAGYRLLCYGHHETKISGLNSEK